jgi:hypothetical protein
MNGEPKQKALKTVLWLLNVFGVRGSVSHICMGK